MTLTFSDFLAIISILVLLCGSGLGLLFKIRHDDFTYIDNRLIELRSSLQRIEDALIQHVHDHATGLFK